MEAVLQDIFLPEQQKRNFLSYLDKGIDDMEKGRVHTLEDAILSVRTRLEGGS